jgi:ADP-dependent NAD(P)H-hydrate dehydratase / NAD(P)H-hydrate epimerase
MTELLTAAQMRAIEAAAIASGEVTGLELMERAGRGVVEAIFEEWPELKAGSCRAVVLCGPGNNGGDGFVVARLLKEWGWAVEVFLYGEPERMPTDARVNYERWLGMGEVMPLVDFKGLQTEYDIGIDALFGTGLTRELANDVSEKLKHFGVVQPIVAIDVPTGLCADSGRCLGENPCWASLTVTFQYQKRGQFLESGPECCGKVVTRDIGLTRYEAMKVLGVYPMRAERGAKFRRPDWTSVTRRMDRIFFEFDEQLGSSRLSKITGHKYAHGHALILSGPSGRGGAARLAARGALRIGAGLVTLGCPPEALAENAARLDAVMLKPVADADALGLVLEDERINALCLGPGLGVDDHGRDLVARALAVPDPIRDLTADEGGPGAVAGTASRAPRPLVLDADALTILSRDPDLFAALHPNCVLTPHAGEFARLFPDIAEKFAAPATKGPAYSKVDATREAAKRAGCTVLYKGPDTVIADASGRCSINSAHYDRAAPWLATAGSGDVLAGFITGLLARGFAPMQAAETAAWLHVECARKFGPGLIAEDLPEQLPAVFRDLGL